MVSSLLRINLPDTVTLQAKGLQTAFEKTANGLELFCDGLAQVRVICMRLKRRVHQQAPTMKRIVQRTIQDFCEEQSDGRSGYGSS